MSEDTPATRWGFPEEVWQRIIYFVPRMKDQPHWHAWTELRSLNRAFKSTVEEYYLEQVFPYLTEYLVGRLESFVFGFLNGHYVKRTSINVRSGELLDLYGGMCFGFSGFNDEEKRIAVFTDEDAGEYDEKKNKSRAGWLANAMAATDDPGFNANTIVTVRRKLTDMLPIDLKVNYTPGECTYRFDWRTYYSTFFDEERAKAAIHDSKKPELEASTERMKAKVVAGQMSMDDALEKFFELMTPFVAQRSEELFAPLRRKRRQRIGFKHPANKEWLESGNEQTHKSFAEFDKDVVMEHIKNMRLGVDYIVFSDSEDGGSAEEDQDEEEEEEEEEEEDGDQDEDEEISDEEDEWEDEAEYRVGEAVGE